MSIPVEQRMYYYCTHVKFFIIFYYSFFLVQASLAGKPSQNLLRRLGPAYVIGSESDSRLRTWGWLTSKMMQNGTYKD